MFALKPSQNLSVSIVLSIGLHGVLLVALSNIFDWDMPWRSQAKGQAQVILLAPSPQTTTPTAGEEESRQANPIHSEQVAGNESNIVTTSAKSAVKAVRQAKPVIQQTKDDVQAQKQVTAAQGTDTPLDTQSENQTELSPYEQKVLNHLLSKMESAPVTGAAKLELTIMKAGVAFGIKIVEVQGPEQYGHWVRQKALSANPYPSFKGAMSTQTVQFWVRHEVEH